MIECVIFLKYSLCPAIVHSGSRLADVVATQVLGLANIDTERMLFVLLLLFILLFSAVYTFSYNY